RCDELVEGEEMEAGDAPPLVADARRDVVVEARDRVERTAEEPGEAALLADEAERGADADPHRDLEQLPPLDRAGRAGVDRQVDAAVAHVVDPRQERLRV